MSSLSPFRDNIDLWIGAPLSGRTTLPAHVWVKWPERTRLEVAPRHEQIVHPPDDFHICSEIEDILDKSWALAGGTSFPIWRGYLDG